MARWDSVPGDRPWSLRRAHSALRTGDTPAVGAEATADTPDDAANRDYALHSFGAQFAEARVDMDTGEVTVPRMLGVFDVGRIVNPITARSQRKLPITADKLISAG